MTRESIGTAWRICKQQEFSLKLLTTAFPDSIFVRRSRLRKSADIGAPANAYRCIRCKIINLQAARLLILQAEDY